MSDPVEVSVVNVDTITQVKAKVLEAVYKDKPYSEYPNHDDLDLSEWLEKQLDWVFSIKTTSMFLNSAAFWGEFERGNFPFWHWQHFGCWRFLQENQHIEAL